MRRATQGVGHDGLLKREAYNWLKVGIVNFPWIARHDTELDGGSLLYTRFVYSTITGRFKIVLVEQR